MTRKPLPTLQGALEEFYSIYGKDGPAPRLFVASGRLNIIGEHIDYNGGFVLPAAIGKGCFIFSRLKNTNGMKLAFTDINKRAEIDYSNLEKYKKEKFINYQAGAIAMVSGTGVELVGLDVLYHITVPFGSGLSSSAAIEVATAYMFTVYHNEKNEIKTPIDHLNLAVLCQKAENQFVGMNCGIMDQFASSCGKKNKAMLLNCGTLKYEYVDCNLGEYVLEIIDTNKPHDLVVSKYNERRQECETGLRILQEKGGADVKGAKFLCDITPEVFEAQGAGVLEGAVLKRARHCVGEQDRVKRVVTALRAGDIVEVGRLLNQSHASLRDLYEVSCLELDVIAATAQAFPGCLGCRMMGAGFGGSCIAIVHTAKVDELNALITKTYHEAIGLDCSVYITTAEDGAREVKIDW